MTQKLAWYKLNVSKSKKFPLLGDSSCTSHQCEALSFTKSTNTASLKCQDFARVNFFFPGSFLFVIVFKSKAWPKTSKTLHPWSLTWNLKIISWKRRFLLETILFRFHVKLQGVQTDTSNWSIVMPRSSVFGIRIGGVVLKAEKFARTWRLEKWKGVVGTPNNKFQEVNMSRFFWHWVFYVATAAGFFDVFFGAHRFRHGNEEFPAFLHWKKWRNQPIQRKRWKEAEAFQQSKLYLSHFGRLPKPPVTFNWTKKKQALLDKRPIHHWIHSASAVEPTCEVHRKAKHCHATHRSSTSHREKLLEGTRSNWESRITCFLR